MLGDDEHTIIICKLYIFARRVLVDGHCVKGLYKGSVKMQPTDAATFIERSIAPVRGGSG